MLAKAQTIMVTVKVCYYHHQIQDHSAIKTTCLNPKHLMSMLLLTY